MISNQYDVLGASQHGDQGLWLGGLCGLVDQHLSELEVLESTVERGHTRGADDLGIPEDLVLSLAP